MSIREALSTYTKLLETLNNFLQSKIGDKNITLYEFETNGDIITIFYFTKSKGCGCCYDDKHIDVHIDELSKFSIL